MATRNSALGKLPDDTSVLDAAKSGLVENQAAFGGNILPLVDTSRFGAGNGALSDVFAAHKLYEHLVARWSSHVIGTAYELGIFAHLAESSATAGELAADLGTDVRATRVLLDALFAYDVVERLDRAGAPPVYVLPEAVRECVLPGGVYSLVGKLLFDQRVGWDAWRGLAEAVRTGSRDSVGGDRINQISDQDYESLVGGINFWAPPIVDVLGQGLHDLGRSTESWSMVDVGCGTGLYSHLLLQAFPTWRATGLDVPRIVPLATAQAERLGVASRFQAVTCDFFRDAWPAPVDLLLFVNIFHLQTGSSAEELMGRAARSLSADGLVCIVDHVVDDARPVKSIQDRFALLFATSMLATGGGDAYTVSEYDQWFAGAGLRRVAVLETPMHRVLLAARS